jgi:hypothetical protein
MARVGGGDLPRCATARAGPRPGPRKAALRDNADNVLHLASDLSVPPTSTMPNAPL